MTSKAPKASEELTKEERLERAINEYNQALLVYKSSSDPRRKKPSVNAIALSWGLIRSTLERRINGQTRSRHQAHECEQRLSHVEEEALKSWILQLAEWDWPPRVSHVRQIVGELLQDKHDSRPLGGAWISQFLDRHKDLQSRFSQPLDKERTATHDTEVLLRWFQLVESTIQKYEIQKEDTYNMDEKGIALGSAGKMRVLCSKLSIQVYKAQDGSREWISLIECISADGRLLPLFTIFKGKRQMKAWFDVLEDKGAWIALSETGWTNNFLGLEWFIRCFEPQTRRTLKGRYRLLIFDGHASHISTKVIEFCISNNIILLCLPPHSTHILQPLDVGFFQPLGTAYRKHLEESTRGGGYTMDKTDFLVLIQMARKNAATSHNIEHSWQKSGLFPIKPEVVLNKLRLPALRLDESTILPGVTVTASNGDLISVPFTPSNIKQVNDLVYEIKKGNKDPILLEKLGKACNSAITNTLLLRSTNNDLMQAIKRKKDKGKRGKAHYGEGKVMNLEVIQQRKDDFGVKQFEKEFRSLSHLNPAIFEDTKKSRSPGKSPRKEITTLPATPGPLRLITLAPPQISRQTSPKSPSKAPQQHQQQQQRQRGRKGGRVQKGGRGERKKKEVVVAPQVEGGGGEEEEEEEAEVEVEEEQKKSRSGRLLRRKEPYVNPVFDPPKKAGGRARK